MSKNISNMIEKSGNNTLFRMTKSIQNFESNTEQNYSTSKQTLNTSQYQFKVLRSITLRWGRTLFHRDIIGSSCMWKTDRQVIKKTV